MAKTMSKSELAAEYGVHTDTLMRWIKKNHKLQGQLQKAGYTPQQRLLTPRQVELIRACF